MKTCRHPCAAITACLLALAACSQPDTKGSSKAGSSASPSAQVVVSDEDVPVAEDYIAGVSEKVTDENYSAELDKLETEINSDN